VVLVTALDVLRDVHARVTRIAEALDLGDYEFVSLALLDLASDVWKAIELLEGEEA
jgi:hypothetical protein